MKRKGIYLILPLFTAIAVGCHADYSKTLDQQLSGPMTGKGLLENNVTFWLARTDSSPYKSDFSYEATEDELSEYLQQANQAE